MTKPNLGTFGAFGHHSLGSGSALQQGQDIEALGLRGDLGRRLAARRTRHGSSRSSRRRPRCKVATGIVNIWTAAAGPVAESFHRIDEGLSRAGSCSASVSGIPRRTRSTASPIDALTEYLDKLDEYGVPEDRRVVAALGPRVLKLSARAQRGGAPLPDDPRAHRRARELIGPDAFLAPEHKVVLTTDAEQGPRGRPQGARDLPEPRELLEQLEAARLHRGRRRQAGQRPAGRRRRRLRHPRCDRGAAEASTSSAGADHVPVQVLTGPDKLVPALAELAGPLGLQ